MSSGQTQVSGYVPGEVQTSASVQLEPNSSTSQQSSNSGKKTEAFYHIMICNYFSKFCYAYYIDLIEID